uniref:Vitellogenin domain-containing protein n=1 Tax=Bombyx mori TaxID=7091 RepID=A0A8R2R577_BOMMO|nr:microsomal triglyceride transfer protein large subunit [Bombyx mori]
MLVLSVLIAFYVFSDFFYITNAIPKNEHEIKLFQTSYNFDVDVTVLLNDVNRTDKEIGYKIKATLGVTPVWKSDDSEFLLKFDLRNPKLHLRGKHPTAEFLPRPSPLDSYSEAPFYALWNKGTVETLYLDPKEMKDVYNLKKALASLFQFHIIDGEYKETDISGECDVIYESISENVFRKMKRRCSWESAQVGCARVARYTLRPARDGLLAVYSEELLTVGDHYGLKFRSFVSLKAKEDSEAAKPSTEELDVALHGLPANLKPMGLPMVLSADDEKEYQTLTEAIDANLAALQVEEAGAGGTSEAADATLNLLPAVRAATFEELRSVLENEENHQLLSGLCRLVGAGGTAAGLRAVDALLQLRSDDPVLHLAHIYLQGFALSDAPQVDAVREILKIGENGKTRSVAESALLAAAAAAQTLAAAGDQGLAVAVKDSLSKGLAKCKDDDCRTVRVQALANLRRPDTAELLLQHAERKESPVSLRVVALEGLGAVPLPHDKLHRLTHVALDDAAPLEVRAAALDLVVLRHVHVPLPLARVASKLHFRSPPELRRIFWQRFRALAEVHDSMRDLYARMGISFKSWDAQALNGTSSVLVRNPGWEAAGWSSKLESVQLAQGGLLRRGVVRLLGSRGGAPDAEALAVEVWTRGLEALAGGGDQEPEGASRGAEEAGMAGGWRCGSGGSG